MNPLAAGSMLTAVNVAREIARDTPPILWPRDWPAPELVAWTLAEMLAATLPAVPAAGERRRAAAKT